jgi:hypothetical protein
VAGWEKIRNEGVRGRVLKILVKIIIKLLINSLCSALVL